MPQLVWQPTLELRPASQLPTMPATPSMMRKTPTAADTIAKDRRAGPYHAIPQVGQACFGLPGTPGEIQEDQADRGRREQGEGQEGKNDDEERRVVTHQDHGGGRGEGPRLLEHPDGGCFPRVELLEAARELLANP
jgi:hypothetical protein